MLEYHLEVLPEPEKDWTVALLNDRGERRATGSYYTPDFVVKYIVETTVDPVLREAVEGAKTGKEKAEAVLALNVLDPSMGSGHFLVEVTEHIARFLVELGVEPEGGRPARRQSWRTGSVGLPSLASMGWMRTRSP